MPKVPGEQFADVLDSDASREDRYAAMGRRRQACPIGRLDAESSWYLASYEATAAAIPEVHHFGGAVGAGDVSEEHQGFNGMPEPQHGKVRRVVNGLIAAHRAKTAESFIVDYCTHLVDRVSAVVASGDGGVDVMDVFVDHLPPAVVAWLLGWPIDNPVQLYRWSVELCDRAMEMAPGSTMSYADLCPDFAAYVDERIAERMDIPESNWPDDGLSHLLHAEIDGRRLSPTFIRTQVIFLLGAGSETSRNLIGSVLLELARDPELYRRIRKDRELIANTVEEGLRMAPPAQFMVRRCTAPIDIEGHTFEPDDKVIFGIASANRDESVFPQPDEFRVDRPNVRTHLAFGGGPHVCPGAHLARLEARIALNLFMDRFQSVRLAPDGFEPMRSAMFDGPKRLRLELVPDGHHGSR